MTEPAHIGRALFLASHPGPTMTVTVAVGALAYSAGRAPSGVAAVLAAVFAGQLSTGWCNDARDGARDIAASRSEKPVVRGWITPPQLAWSAVIALALCLPLSYVAGGATGGGIHVLAVASAWFYNLALKTTLFSIVPYVISFGAVPAFVTYGLTPSRPPQLWGVAAAGLIGAAAHLANAAPDIESDQQVGAGGLVAALGAATSRLLAVVALLAASGLVVHQLDVGVGVAALTVGLLIAGATVAWRWQGGRWLFAAVLVMALVDVALLLSAAGSLANG